MTPRPLRFPCRLFITLLLLGVACASPARELRTIMLEDETEVEVRVFGADGDALILGFACDEGSSEHEEHTAAKLAEDGVEVWMPDLLGAYWLPDLPSSIAKIPADAVKQLAREAAERGKDVYLMAGGADTGLVLRALAAIENDAAAGSRVHGAILLFPRLLAGDPQPGKEPEYEAAVGTTRSPLLVIEGERTPNRWGLPHLQAALAGGGSEVTTLVVPDVRGYFYNRADANLPEDVVTSQLHGLIKASLFRLRNDS